MWIRVSRVILRNKIVLLSLLALITAFFAYHATKVEMSSEYASLFPKKDQAFKDYQEFVKIFGEEGNLIIIGIQDSNFFRFERFHKWRELCNELTEVDGVENLLSVTNACNLKKNTGLKQFAIEHVFPDSISNLFCWKMEMENQTAEDIVGKAEILNLLTMIRADVTSHENNLSFNFFS